MQNFKALEYIKIAMANAYGLDRKLWSERIAFSTKVLEDNSIKKHFDEAKEPMLFIKAVNAYKDALNQIPSGYMMNLDATASGMQIMACVIGCKKTAIAVNLICNGLRNCPYDYVAKDLGETRDRCKKPTMTHYYNSKKQPETVFGDMVDTFLAVLLERFPGAEEVMQDIQSCWRSDVLENTWTLPDGHVAKVKNMVAVEKTIEIDELNHGTFKHRLYENATADYGLSLPANIIHSIDGYVVREMVRRAHAQGFELLTIHDSFWARPQYMNKVRQNYMNILADIADMNLMQDILRSVTGNQDLEYIKYSDDLGDLIREAEYPLS